MRIVFVNKTRSNKFRAFDYSSLEGMRGGERTVIYLAQALGRRGHDVVIACEGVEETVRSRGFVIAAPNVALAREYDVVVSNNYAKAFDGFRAPTKVVWTHNPGFSWAHVRADYAAKARHLPHLVHLSRYTERRSWLLPRSGQRIIRHGMPEELLDARRERAGAPPPVAVFASYAGRNLDQAVLAWRDVVHPNAPDARLLVATEVRDKDLGGVPSSELKALNIEIVGSLPWTRLMELLRTTRVFVAPGHRQETFNLLSIEAAACGVPTATMGIGALRERVLHDETGWIGSSRSDMGAAMARMLTDDAVWNRYHKACLRHPDLVSWEDRAQEWEDYLITLPRPARTN
jgi:glycosyltransferase involved in cell wall biosynthesis